MGRLIDADELNELMTSEWFLDSLAANESPREIKKKLENAIDSVPLAYDVEKVVTELEELPNSEADYYYAPSNDAIDREDAIDIVRRGGVE